MFYVSYYTIFSNLLLFTGSFKQIDDSNALHIHHGALEVRADLTTTTYVPKGPAIECYVCSNPHSNICKFKHFYKKKIIDCNGACGRKTIPKY